MRLRPLGIGLALSVVLSGEFLAGVGSWTSQGPQAGRIGAIAVVSGPPQTVFVHSPYGGIFRSRDGGASWQAAHAGITYPSVEELVQDPRRPGTLYAATYGGGVFKTTDYGAVWSPANSGLTNLLVTAFALDTATGALYAGTDGGLFRSSDAGATWGSAGTGLPFGAYAFSSIEVHPARPSTLYAAVSPGLFKSTNGGDSWTPVGPGIPSAVSVVRGDPFDGSTVYAGTFMDGLYKSTDGGATWSPKNNGLTGNQVTALAFDPTGPGRIFLAAIPVGAGEQGGLFRSGDSAESWGAVDTGVAGTPYLGCTAVAVDGASPQTLYAGLQTSAFRGYLRKSSNGGTSWTVADSGLTGSLASAVATDPTDPNRAYAVAFSRFYRTTDRGRSWTFLSALPAGTFDLALDPLRPNRYFFGSNTGVYVSQDGGMSWAQSNAGLTSLDVRGFAFARTSLDTIYAATSGGGVFKSIDGGGSWTAVSNGLTSLLVNSVAVAPTNESILYAGTSRVQAPTGTFEGGVYRSTNGGASWTNVLPNLFVVKVLFDPLSSAVAYALSESGGVYKTTDGGSTWISRSAGLPLGGFLTDLAVDPAHPETLFVLIFGSVFRTTDGAKTWAPFSEGLLWGFQGYRLAANATGQSVYLATYGGLYDYRFSAASFHTVAPCRALDTRAPIGPFGGPAPAAGSERTFTLLGRCGISPTATSVAANITVTQASAAGHLTVYPATSPLPPTSTINYRPGQTRANNTVLSLDYAGRFTIRTFQAGGTAQVILDVSGYFE